MQLFIKKQLTPFLVILFSAITSFAFSQASADQADMFGIGVGYGGGLGAPGISYGLLPGYSGTASPRISLSYDRKMSKNFSLGAVFSYSTINYSNPSIPYNIAIPQTAQTYTGNVSDHVTGTYLGLGAKGAYHFAAGDVVDPYAGLILGVTLTTQNHTISSDSIGTIANNETYAGILLGAFVGARFYVSDKIGIWVEVDYSGVPSYLGNIGVTYQISHF